MKLTVEQVDVLKNLMENSARKGNLANAGLVLENGKMIASAESLVVTNHNATDHSERMLVEIVCNQKEKNYTPGLTMVTVCQPCLMCLSACSQAGYKTVVYIIPAKKYVEKIPWMSDNTQIDMSEISKTMTDPVELIHLSDIEEEFSVIFEEEMKSLLK